MVKVPTRIFDCGSHSPALFDLFMSSDARVCSKMAFPLGNSDHVVVTVSNDFSSNSKGNTSFHRIDNDYSHADWDVLSDQLRDGSIGGYLLNSVLLSLQVNFASGFRLELMYISLIVNIRLNPTYLRGFQLLVLLI